MPHPRPLAYAPQHPRTRVHVFTHSSGARGILPLYFDPWTQQPIRMNHCLLVAGAHHEHGLYANTVVMDDYSFRNYIAECEAEGGAPVLPYTNEPIHVACRCDSDGTYTDSKGKLKNVFWTRGAGYSETRRLRDLLDSCFIEPKRHLFRSPSAEWLSSPIADDEPDLHNSWDMGLNHDSPHARPRGLLRA
jgi:hypothetical protein